MNNYQKTSMDDIIFEGRNKQYGVYELRQNIDRNASIGLLITASALTAMLLLYAYNPFQTKTANDPIIAVDAQTTIITFPPEEIIQPKPIDPPAATPKVNSQLFTEIRPVETPTQAAPITQEVAANSNISTATVTDGIDRPYTAPIETPTTTGTGTGITETATTVAKTDNIETFVSEMPTYIGGKDAMMEYLRKSIKPFASDIENGGSGKVILRFYIDTDGTVRSPEVLKDNIGGRCAEAAIIAVKKMPKWKAGKQNGNAVKVYFTLPVTFDFTKN